MTDSILINTVEAPAKVISTGMQGVPGVRGERGLAGSGAGDSAFVVAQANGFVGTEQEWLDSLKGADGAAGSTGAAGANGVAGADGKSAYELAVLQGFTGTLQEWLDSINGTGNSAYESYIATLPVGATVLSEYDWITSLHGLDGADGMTPYEAWIQFNYGYYLKDNGTNDRPPYYGHYTFWEQDPNYITYENWFNQYLRGATGATGDSGLSAYQVAQLQGFVGTEAEWLVSLKGAKGDQGEQGIQGEQGLAGTGGTTYHAALTDTATSGHPASVIAFTPTGTISSTNVQDAIAEIASESAAPDLSAYAPINSPVFTNGIKSAGAGAIASNFAAGNSAFAGHSPSASGSNNVAIGNQAQTNDYAASDNVALGSEALKSVSSGIYGFTINAAGTGYTSATVAVSAPASGGVQSTATVGLISGGISYFLAISPGTKYDSTATATISGNGTGAVVTPRVLTGSYNVAIGSQALQSSVYSFEQVAIGYQALKSNTAAFDSSTFPNVAVGTRALFSGATVRGAVCVGYEAGKTGNGDGLVAIGNLAGKAGTSTANSTFVGSRAGENCNAGTVVAIGYYAGSFSAINNTYVGASAGFLNTGAGNVAVGNTAIGTSGNGAYNTAIGEQSHKSGTTASYNVSVGYMAAYSNVTGSYNVALGHKALYTNATSSNTAVGYNALYNCTGTRNTAIGDRAGVTGVALTTGSNNILIGCDAQPSAADVSNEITLGSTTSAVLRCNTQSITALSDIRDKTHIKTLPVGLSFINELNPVKFTWNTRDGSRVGIEEAGFIAQDLDTVQTSFGADYLGLVYKNNPERMEASYSKLLPVLVKALQELSDKNNYLEARLANLEALHA